MTISVSLKPPGNDAWMPEDKIHDYRAWAKALGLTYQVPIHPDFGVKSCPFALERKIAALAVEAVQGGAKRFEASMRYFDVKVVGIVFPNHVYLHVTRSEAA